MMGHLNLIIGRAFEKEQVGVCTLKSNEKTFFFVEKMPYWKINLYVQ